MNKELFGVHAPTKDCTDKKCPFHGQLSVKKELFRGKIIKKDSNRSATIEWFRPYYIPKYERYELRRSRMHVHNPACVEAEIGDNVLAARTRPLSKTKNHVILAVVGSDEKSAVSKSAKKKETAKVAAKEEGKVR
ncbi:MAG: 30S ribosomal protein S17 [Nanoarchaeota archaeon]|nr:30S ribosomal protein S17 [Nanoarchaeota archaeon]